MTRRIRPAYGVLVAPVTPYACKVVNRLPNGGIVEVDAKGHPVLIIPYIPLQVSHIYPRDSA